MHEVRAEAERRGITLTAFFEQSLRHELARSKENGPRPRFKIPVSSCKGWVLPGVNIDSNGDLQAFLDAGLPLEKLR
jgi:hypothetical protein